MFDSIGKFLKGQCKSQFAKSMFGTREHWAQVVANLDVIYGFTTGHNLFSRKSDNDWCCQPFEFECDTGIMDIGRRYIMPGGKSMKSVIFDARKGDHTRAQEILGQIIELNPDIKTSIKWNPENPREIWVALNGITTGFNPQDIDYFINCHSKKKLKDQITFICRQSALGKKAGVWPDWILSPETEAKVRDYFGIPQEWEPSSKEIEILRNEYFLANEKMTPRP